MDDSTPASLITSQTRAEASNPDDAQCEALDEEVAAIRAQIRDLTSRRRLVTSSLLTSNSTQSLFKNRSSSNIAQQDVHPILSSSEKHANTNLHRLAFSTTSFPFSDPSPNSTPSRLLGVRIDICVRGGKFAKPYYVLLQRAGKDGKTLRIHRHTIPIFIPLKALGERYLPCSAVEEDADSLKPRKKRKQNLQRLVRELRRELVAWHLRTDAVDHLREELGIAPDSDDNDPNSNAATDIEAAGFRRGGAIGLTSLQATSLEARYIRLEWDDGRVGRIKISNRGKVDRAVVYGRKGRERTSEQLLLADGGSIEDLARRLKN